MVMWKRKISRMLMCILVVGLLFAHPEIAKADTATVTFGSESYTAENNGEFMVGVYLTGESRVGTYHVEIEYDANRLEYLGGAESGGNGKIILEGTGLREQIKYMLSFRTLSGGEAYIRVDGARINMSETENEQAFEITELDEAVITISGADTVGDVPEPERPGFETELPHIDSVIVIGQTEHYLLDLTQMMPEEVSASYKTANISFLGHNATFLTDEGQNIYVGYLFDETETLVCYAYNAGQSMFYPCETYAVGEKTYLYTSVDACAVWPDELSRDAVSEQNIVFAVDEAGQGMFCHMDDEGNLVEWDTDSARDSQKKQNNKLVWILLIALIVIAIALGVAYFANQEMKRKKLAEKKAQRRREEKKKTADVQVADLGQATEVLPNLEKKSEKEDESNITPAGAPVIEVKDVTMRFKVATSNVSGIKEYLIQLLKKQISYRELLALDHVSFNVYKGEVVGIIGTNGSGKSTLLRIVSGALDPTEGKVRVNRKKLQLLTLGTGFDMELTARENVYLNGAIIGYTEEFINEHYDEIVAFAELEGFMEEKVKNFSSGMVSRLGFAIATVGEASEILILDEVLSVGDEFFRKKSLARVKEMIHGGSTVLMVSHGMGTIREHCSKVVWIEKGKLKMVGTPEVVCTAYQKQFENPNVKKIQSSTVNQPMKNGLKCENGIWYLYKDGILDKETSLASNQYGWWYVKDGKIDFSYTGLAQNQHGWWYVKDGKIDFSYTGLAQNQHGWWYVQKGKLNFSFSGECEWNGKHYHVTNGKAIEKK